MVNKQDRYTVKSLIAKLSLLPDDALVVIDNHGECRFLKDGDVEVERDEYVCMDEDECEPIENDPEDGKFFPCVVRLTSWS